MLWNAAEHDDAENRRWAWLRAIEWGVWPRFVSQPVIPILLIFYPWYWVVAGLILTTYLWMGVRYKWVSVNLADIGCLFVRIKWITSPIAAIILYRDGHAIVGSLALFWPLATLFLTLTGPTARVGKIELMFMQKIGYIAPDRAKAQAQ